jgi:Peptidase family M23
MKHVVILLPVLFALQVGVQPAFAWTWPVDGPVLRPFTIGDDPYVAGQHRGVDVAAPAGASVRAPAGGTVSFAGTVPGGGRTVTIRTPDGYSVTLLHLGTVLASRSSAVSEGDPVATVGPSGDAEHGEPYVHLGVRLTADSNGYLDPLDFLPPHAEPAPKASPDPAPQPHSVPGVGQHPTKRKLRPAADTQAVRPLAVRRVSRPHAEAPLRRAGLPERARRSSSRTRTVTRTMTLPRDEARFFERPVATPSATQPARSRAGSRDWPAAPFVGCLGAVLFAALAALGLRRQLRDAGSADGTAPVLLELAAAAAKDAGGLRLREEDRLVVDGDLERILLSEPETLSDLDGNDDTAELVEVPNDARGHTVSPAGRSRRPLSRPQPGTWPFSAGAHA